MSNEVRNAGMRILLVMMLIACSIIGVKATDPGPNIENKAVKKVQPLYPPLAKRKRIEGKVVVALQISPDGNVAGADFVEGNSMFKPVSLDAAKQWGFQKTSGGMSGHITFKFQIVEQ
jgi:TonB family protein